MPRVYIFLPYYGTLPNYFQLYLDSLEMNTDILSVFLITDIDLGTYSLPPNLVVISMSKDQVRERTSKMLLNAFDKRVPPEDLLHTNYKFVDFKVTYPFMFADILAEHNVTEEDFVGFSDCDLIYGKLSNFIKFEGTNYHILGGWHGHFVAFRNIDAFKLLFKRVPNFFELCTDNSRTHITDEIAFRQPLITFLRENSYNMFYANAHFCDIVPPCFFHMFRQDHAQRDKNFFDVYNSGKNITNLYYNKGKNLTVYYDDGTHRETLYCHLQKRKMDLPFSTYADGYFISEHAFFLSK
jgi:hypothetical protein